MSDEDRGTVLVVEDGRAMVEIYDLWLDDRFDVRTALDGEAALSSLDDSVDVVLLDRMMPGISGDEVLARINDRDIDCRVAIVSALDPDFDIVREGFDAYLTKPVGEEALIETVETLLRRSEYDDRVGEYYELVSQRAALEANHPISELEDDERYAELSARIEELEADLDGYWTEFSADEDFSVLIRDASDEPE